MRFFEQLELARRYHAYRPRVHEQVIQEIAASRPARSLNAALDVACGTGHSTAALTALAATVYGCDSSWAMLSIAREEISAARFLCCQAEALPFPADTFDLVTVSLAFHWFDQEKVLGEVGRVLAPFGELWVYNLFFPGILLGGTASSDGIATDISGDIRFQRDARAPSAACWTAERLSSSYSKNGDSTTR